MEEIKKNDDKILSVQNVHTTFRTHGKSVKAVRGVSFYAAIRKSWPLWGNLAAAKVF